MKDPCENCKLKPCARKCMFAQMYKNGPAIAKSEAIEKMAKAICKNYGLCEISLCEMCLRKAFIEQAKAALNALLEDKYMMPTQEQLKYLGSKLEELQNEASDQIMIAYKVRYFKTFEDAEKFCTNWQKKTRSILEIKECKK